MGALMTKATKVRKFKVLMSFEVNRRTLPKSKEGILVKGDKCKREWFAPEKLVRLLKKKYLKELPGKKPRRKNKKSRA
jgi:hypothetical protein